MIAPMYLHRLLLATFFVGLVGTSSELVLLEHYEDRKQLIPFGVAVLGFLSAAWYGWKPSPLSVRVFQWILGVFAVTGAVGTILHYRGNVEFELERDASLGGFRLFWESLHGATPALAPGTMVFLALVGYAATVARQAVLASPRS